MSRLELDIAFPFRVAYLANLQIVRWSGLQIAVTVAFPLAGLFLLYTWIKHHHVLEGGDVVLLVACFFMKPLVTLLAMVLGRWKSPLASGPFKYCFDADGIHASGSTFNMSLKWAAIQKVRESRSFIFFFVAPGRAHAIPRDQLRAAGMLDDVRTLTREKVTNTRLRDA